jgi:uncharacterized protein (DUF1501 family)
MKRRDFMRNLMAAGAGTFAATFYGNPFRPRMRFAHAQSGVNTLVIVFQRGGADGLNECVPHGLQEYYDIRPNISIPRPDAGDPTSALDLDGFFGLHPALEPIKSVYDDGDLAIFPACHYPDATRSHFSGQQNIESGEDSDNSDGWLNRYLDENPRAAQLRAVGFGSGLAHALKGNVVVSSFNDIGSFSLNLSPTEEADLLADLSAAYAQGADPTRLTRELVVETGRVMVNDVSALSPIIDAPYTPAPGATYPGSTFGRQMRQTAQLIKADVGLEVASVALGGWDTHSDEGTATGRMASRLTDFAETLRAFQTDIDAVRNRVMVLTMSEFGRTSVENGSLGTDHAHATTWFAMGASVNGGQVYPHTGGNAEDSYPGKLEGLQAVRGRYLNHSVDFRDVMGEALTDHLGVSDLSTILPGHAVSPIGYVS